MGKREFCTVKRPCWQLALLYNCYQMMLAVRFMFPFLRKRGCRVPGLHMLSLTHSITHIAQSQLPGLSLTMTDRALSPIDWKRAGRYESKKKKKERKEGTKGDRQSGSPTDKSHLISGSRGREGVHGYGGTGIEGSGSFAQMHQRTHTCTHTRLTQQKHADGLNYADRLQSKEGGCVTCRENETCLHVKCLTFLMDGPAILPSATYLLRNGKKGAPQRAPHNKSP